MGRGPEPVDAGPRLAGNRGRSRREWELLAAQLGTEHFDSILDEPNPVLHPGDDHTLEPGERRRTPVGSVRAAVAPRRDRKDDRKTGRTGIARPEGQMRTFYSTRSTAKSELKESA
jgi:hypothetical protein